MKAVAISGERVLSTVYVPTLLHCAFMQCTRLPLIFGSQGWLEGTQALPPKSRIFIAGVETARVQPHYEMGLCIMRFYAGMVADQVGASFRVIKSLLGIWHANDDACSFRCRFK